MNTVRILRAALVRAPDHAESWHRLGVLALERGDANEAARLIVRALVLAPDDAFALNNLGNALKLAGRPDAAVPALERAADRQPDHPAIRANLGAALLDAGRLADACDQLAEAMRLDPANRDAGHLLGTALYRLSLAGSAAEAAARAEAWRAARPGDPVARHVAAALTGEGVPERCPDDWVAETFDRFADSFDDRLAAVGYRVPELIGEALARAAPPVGALRILDAGCGTGLCAPWLRVHAAHLTGVDLSARMLEHAARRNVYDTLTQDEVTAFLARHEHTFDLIVAADLLIYFGALDGFLAAAGRALAPGGRLLIAIEQGPEPESWTLTGSGRYAHGAAYLRRVLDECGFAIVAWTDVHLRRENGRPVAGFFIFAGYPARKPSVGGASAVSGG